ncbi:hypothetical protein [Megaira polyxenophila phage MAnkyphage_25.80]|nr:hypothetical protein [Megaira polyxenophila phage MAnkyphage_25.80]
MTPILNYFIRIFELIITSLIYITCEYFMGLNILYALSATFLALGVVVYLEAKGINHKICDWFIKLCKIAIPLKDALAMYANSVAYKSNPDYNNKKFKHIFEEDKGKLVPQELFTLLQFARDGRINLYGRKSFSSPRVALQPIPAEYLFENKSNWSEDYSTIYYNSGDTAYTDVSVKRKELEEILK